MNPTIVAVKDSGTTLVAALEALQSSGVCYVTGLDGRTRTVICNPDNGKVRVNGIFTGYNELEDALLGMK